MRDAPRSGADACPVRVAVLISGTGSNMAALLYASRLPERHYGVALVVSDQADAPGLALARAEGVAVAVAPRGDRTREQHEAGLQAVLVEHGTEVVALAGYMRILSPAFVAGWEGRMLNVHPSLLPAHRGLDTHARALAAGDTLAGCTVHRVTGEVDAGEVLGQLAVAVQPGDHPERLAARVLLAEHQLYPRVLNRVCSALRERS